MTVAELLARISSAELSEWRAYEKIAGPLGSARGDIQAGIIAQTVANSQRGKGQAAMKLSAFIPTWDKQPMTPDEMWAAAMAANAALGGEVRTTTT